jgi:hypothetical protein
VVAWREMQAVGRRMVRLGFTRVVDVVHCSARPNSSFLSLEPNEMIKKRTRPQTRLRDPSADPSDSATTQLEENQAQDNENGDIPYVTST